MNLAPSVRKCAAWRALRPKPDDRVPRVFDKCCMLSLRNFVMEDSVVEVALILYGIFAIAVLVSITASRVRVKYSAISTATLDSLMFRCENALVIALREANNRIVPGALLVPADQLSGASAWGTAQKHSGPIRPPRGNAPSQRDRNETAGEQLTSNLRDTNSSYDLRLLQEFPGFAEEHKGSRDPICEGR
jgi:hypothetical protein